MKRTSWQSSSSQGRGRGAGNGMTVVKAGGSLLTDRAGLERVARALARRHGRGRLHGRRLVVVASALRGVTDQLEQATYLAWSGEALAFESHYVLDALRRRHCDLARELGMPVAPLEEELSKVEELLAEIARDRCLPEATYTRILSAGERLSVPLLTWALEREGVPAQAKTAEQAGLLGVGPLRSGRCDLERSRPGLRRAVEELKGRTLVLTGFYGRDPAGRTLLFGRGGSDYTAGVVAALLEAEELELWKDVPACLTADPQWVPEARQVPELSFREAAGLAAGGSRLLHPRCLKPLEGRAIRVSILSPESAGPGTHLVEHLPSAAPSRGHRRGEVVALAARASRVRLRLASPKRPSSSFPSASDHGRGVFDPCLGREVVRRLQETGLRTQGGAQGAVLQLTVEDDLARITKALGGLPCRQLATLELRREPARIHLVGEGIGHRCELARAIEDELERLGVEAGKVRKGSAGVALVGAVLDGDLSRAVSGLHERFLAGAPEALAVGSRR